MKGALFGVIIKGYTALLAPVIKSYSSCVAQNGGVHTVFGSTIKVRPTFVQYDL